MEPITHTLTGVVLSRAGVRQGLGKVSAGTLIIASLAPDVDYVTHLMGTATYLYFHRGFTHSFLGVITLSAILATVAARLDARTPWRTFFLIALLGTSVHVLLDLINPYGVRLLYPWDRTWYAWDIIFVVDPILWAVLAAGILLWRYRPEWTRKAAMVTLALLLLYGGIKAWGHHQAMALARGHFPQARQVGAFPQPFNPLPDRWYVLARKTGETVVAKVNLWDRRVRLVRLWKEPHNSRAVEIARETRTARIFLDFAQYPHLFKVHETTQGWVVAWTDLRFSLFSPNPHFVAEVRLDRAMKVVEERFWF